MSETTEIRLGDYDPDFTPPSVELVTNITALGRAYFQPQFFGMENLDKDKPAMYITNHNILGVLDGTLWAAEMYREKGIFCRSLVDDFHYQVPGWRDVAENVGFVRGTRENCATMMKAGEHIMVYPGGARETSKRKGEKYKLTWKKRTGFARMAIEHGYDIITVAQVGQEDAFDIVMDPDEIMESRFGNWLKENGIAEKYFKNGDSLPPLARGIAFTPIPKPEKQYYSFGQRISTKEYKGKTDEESLWELRSKVEMHLELEITKLRIKKLEDGDGGWLRGLLNRL
ncbi:MAG: acyltransferase family protein [Flavobacteriales bacterium]|nr:acyltransferase family protein [Flavobacteriales bacterium]